MILSLVAPLALVALAQDPGAVPDSASAAGYTLIAPLRSTSTYLLDGDGTPVHEWKSDATPGHAVYLLPNGNLLRTERTSNEVFSGGGQGGRLRELAWDGTVVWEYECSDGTRMQHHDIEPLPNGNVLLIAWEYKSGEEAFAAGRDARLLEARELWPDMVLEIEPTRPKGGKVVWEWHAWDHLVQERKPGLANYGKVAESPHRIDVNATGDLGEPDPDELARLRKLGYAGDDATDGRPGERRAPGADWLHCNSIDYSPELDMIVLSSRELSELWFLDHSTTTAEARGSTGGRWGHGGDLLFRWGNPARHGATGERTLFHQHDARWIPAGYPGAGNLTVFNNGEAGVRERSTVDELAIPFSAASLKDPFGAQALEVRVVASYASPDFSSHISGAERLANGNTLICAGETGRVVEVTADGARVWEHVNALGGDGGGPDRGEGRPGPGGRGRGAEPGGEPDRRPPPRGDAGGRGHHSAAALFRAAHVPADHPALARLRG